MRTIINNVVSIALAIMIGFTAQSVMNNIEDNTTVTSIAYRETNEVSEISGTVEYQPDGDIIVDFSDNSSILINDEEGLYIMWLPETEDYEHCYNTEEELMTAIDEYHGAVTNITYPDKRSGLNPQGYSIVADELGKVDKDVLELLERTGLEIIYSDETIDIHEDAMQLSDNCIVLGYYNSMTNRIVMREERMAIENALLHEIGHALDEHIGLRYNETIIDSYMRGEIVFSDNNEYYYSCIEEYIAQSISDYYNDLLDKDTMMYQELNYILG